MIIETMIKRLRTSGLKVTPQRRFIIQALEQTSHYNHPTAEDIYQVVKETLPDISLTTVYNTLRELVSLGVLRQVDLGERMTHFDPNTEIHHHLLCTRCGYLEDLYRQFPDLYLAPTESNGFQITSHQVIFEGICPNCQKNSIH